MIAGRHLMGRIPEPRHAGHGFVRTLIFGPTSDGSAHVKDLARRMIVNRCWPKDLTVEFVASYLQWALPFYVLEQAGARLKIATNLWNLKHEAMKHKWGNFRNPRYATLRFDRVGPSQNLRMLQLKIRYLASRHIALVTVAPAYRLEHRCIAANLNRMVKSLEESAGIRGNATCKTYHDLPWLTMSYDDLPLVHR